MNFVFLPKDEVIGFIAQAIVSRTVLIVRYQHKADGEIVDHRIAPFDIGSSDPKRAEGQKNNLFAYTYTAIDKKTSLPAPALRCFSLDYFISIERTDQIFDEGQLADQMASSTFSYRNYLFAFMPDRNWFGV
jgi:hypothetical protein